MPTPEAALASRGCAQHLAKRKAGGHSVSLADAVHGLLPTPRASRGASATETVEMLPTPKAGDADFGTPLTSGRPPEKSTHLAGRLRHADFGDYTTVVDRWEQVIGRSAPAPLATGAKGGKQLNPSFVEWMMGLPEGHVTATEIGLSRVQQLRALGNGVVPQQAAAAVAALLGRAAA